MSCWASQPRLRPTPQCWRVSCMLPLEAKEALSQRLAEQERQHSQALEALQQRLQATEGRRPTRQLAELGPVRA